MAYSLVIFDVDGTLADSLPFLLSVFNQLASQHGFLTISMQDVPRLRQLPARQIMRELQLPLYKLPRVSQQFIQLMRQHAAQIPLFPGIDQVLQQLAARGVQLAIVSSNARPTVRHLLGNDLTSLFCTLECGMSMFNKAHRLRQLLERLEVAPCQAIYIGDQTTDASAARQAGIAFGAVSWGYNHIDALRALAPAHEFADVQALYQLADGLPSASGYAKS